MFQEPFVVPAPGAHPFGDVADVGAFFDVSLDLLVIRDLEGRVVKASASWRTLLGHDPDAMVGQRLLDLVHPEAYLSKVDPDSLRLGLAVFRRALKKRWGK